MNHAATVSKAAWPRRTTALKRYRRPFTLYEHRPSGFELPQKLSYTKAKAVDGNTHLTVFRHSHYDLLQ